MDWKQEVFKRLDAMGEKLGVAAGHLWAILVRQAYVEGISEIVGAAIGIVLIVLALLILRKYYSYPKQIEITRMEYDYVTGKTEKITKYRDRDDEYGAMFAPIAILAVLGLLLVMVCGIDGMQRLVNPEYFALKEILEVVK